MDGHIFTTKGWLPQEQVRLSVAITEDDNAKVIRTDKFLAATDEWVGNDLRVEMKKSLPLFGEQGAFH